MVKQFEAYVSKCIYRITSQEIWMCSKVHSEIAVNDFSRSWNTLIIHLLASCFKAICMTLKYIMVVCYQVRTTGRYPTNTIHHYQA